MTLEVLLCQTYQGKPYHALPDQDKISVDDMIEKGLMEGPREIFYRGKDWDLYHSLKEICYLVSNDQENGQMYLSIDQQNMEEVMIKVKEKIEHLLQTSDLYDYQTYEGNSDLFTWTKFYSILQHTKEEKGFRDWYLMVDISW